MKLILAFISLMTAHILCADDSAPLQAKLNAIKTMKSSFYQVVKAKKKIISSSSGTMALSRPVVFVGKQSLQWNKSLLPMEKHFGFMMLN